MIITEIEQQQISWFFYTGEYTKVDLAIMYGTELHIVERAVKRYRRYYEEF